MLELLTQLGEELAAKFVKQYSAGRLEQIMSHLATMKMLVSHIHDEAVREEHPDRKDGVIQSMVLAGRSVSDARDAVERGER